MKNEKETGFSNWCRTWNQWRKKENLTMEVLEKLRFKDLSRLLVKNYDTGTIRMIRNRAHNGFVFCNKGELLFIKDEKEYLCDTQHVVLIPKGTDYDIEVKKASQTFIVDFELDEGKFAEMYRFPISESHSFYQDYLNMEKRIFGLASYKLANLSNLYDIAARIDNYGHNEKKYGIIKESEKYLEENIYNGKISIQDIADKSNISEVYFRRLFKEKYGTSPIQYINVNRLKTAKNLLVEDNLSVSEISQVCGFLDVYSFSRAFKKWAGVSPSQYKKDMQFRNC